jgi:small subunit ribosomal protein S20
MPQTKSAKKRLRQSLQRRAANRAGRSKLKTLVKKVRAAVAAGNAEAIQTALRVAQKNLDQAAAKGLIHRNAAARIKSRLCQHVKKAAAKA